MYAKKSALLALLALAAAPLAANAGDGSKAAVNACVKSFVESYLPDRRVKQIKTNTPPPSPIDAYYAPREYSIALSAYGVRSGDLLAQAHCVASRDGVVLVLDSPVSREYLTRADFTVSIR